MFKNLVPVVLKNLSCTEPIAEGLLNSSADYYDKDGFELTDLELVYYKANNFDTFINDCLYHWCIQDHWYEVEHPCFSLDHALILHRCDFKGEARKQLEQHIYSNPKVSYLLQSEAKWGLDFSLDYIYNGKVTEVLHIEQDTRNYEQFLNMKDSFEKFVEKTDWEDFYRFLNSHRDEWEHLVGFEQNDWKAQKIGFKKAEVTQKSI